MIPATLVVLALALGVGVLASTTVQRRASEGDDGLKLDLVVSPLLTLTALLLAFVLVQVFSSYTRVKLSTGEEAGMVVGEFKQFGLLPEPYATRGQTNMVCYARAVAEVEWPQLGKGLRVAPEPGFWIARLDVDLRELADRRSNPPFGSIVNTDRERIDARRSRLMEARPAVPPPVTWLMLAVSAVSILSIAMITPVARARRLQIAMFSLLAAVFAAVQITIIEIDDKFDGLIRVEPEEMRLVLGVMEQVLADTELPCDAQGRPL